MAFIGYFPKSSFIDKWQATQYASKLRSRKFGLMNENLSLTIVSVLHQFFLLFLREKKYFFEVYDA